jgi:polyhydroxyalkanoate synthase
MTKGAADRHVDADTWLTRAPRKHGSWWPEWIAWLNARSGALVDPPALDATAVGYPPLRDAPGEYVLQQ